MTHQAFRGPPDRQVAVAARSSRSRTRPARLAAWAVLVVILLGVVFPFYWMVRESLTHNAEIFSDFGLWPRHPTFVNFLRVLGLATPEQQHVEAPQSFQTIDILADLRNSIIFTVVVTFGSVFFGSMSAYAFSRLHWPGRDVVFGIFLTGLLMPPIFAILPNFTTIHTLGWIGTWPGLVAPYLLLQPFAVFFLRQFYLNLPEEIEEAAELDGLSKWSTYWRITLPLSTAPIATMLTIQAVFVWNEYLWPLLVTQTGSTEVLTAALGNFVRNSPQSSPDWSGFMAATTVTVIPLVLFVILFGKKLVSNIQLSSGGK